jgi:hypothetical protein
MASPEFVLTKGATIEDLVAMFEKLTGRQATEDEIREAEWMLRESKADAPPAAPPAKPKRKK